MSQRQKLIYQAIDEETEREVIGLEFRRGMMKEEQMMKDEAKLLPIFLNFVSEAQANAR